MERLPFITLDYLREGTRRQRWAYHNLTDLGIVEILKDYTPLLAGTVPLDIDIATSDLDIICHWQDAQEFTNTLEKHWGERPDFRVYQTALTGPPTSRKPIGTWCGNTKLCKKWAQPLKNKSGV